MNSRLVFQFVASLLIAGTGVNFTLAQQQSSPLAKFVTPDAFAAVIVYPSAIANLPEMELMPKEIIAAAAVKEVGFDPLDIEEAIFFSEPPQPAGILLSDPTKPAGGTTDFCAIVRFKNAVDSAKLFPQLAGELEPATIEGKKALVAKIPMLPSILFYDERTIFFAPEAMFFKVLKPATKTSPLAAKLQGLAGKSHAMAVVMVPPVREMVNEAIFGVPTLPPPLEALKKLPQLVDEIEIHLNAGATGGIKLALAGTDKAAAEKIQSTVISAMDFGKEMLLTQTSQLDTEDPIQAASAKYTARMADYFQKLLRPKLIDKVVSLELKNDGGTQFATVGVGVSLLLPAVQAAREASRRMSSMNNLKQLGLAMHNYHDVYGKFPDQGTKAFAGKPGLSWRVHLLPFLEESELYDQFHMDEPWDSEHNKKLIDQMPAVYRAPGSKLTNKTNYLTPIGKGAAFESGKKLTFFTITDGTSNTIMVVEASDERAAIWTKPDDYEIDADDPIKGLVGLRPGGFQAAFFDGSARFISQTVDAAVLKAMFTMQGGEVFNLP